MSMDDIKNWPGWQGAFTRGEASGALRNGTPIIKVNSEEGDGHPDGTPGTVLGSMSHPEVMSGMIFYFVAWAPRPRTAVGVAGFKVEAQPTRQS